MPTCDSVEEIGPKKSDLWNFSSKFPGRVSVLLAKSDIFQEIERCRT